MNQIDTHIQLERIGAIALPEDDRWRLLEPTVTTGERTEAEERTVEERRLRQTGDAAEHFMLGPVQFAMQQMLCSDREHDSFVCVCVCVWNVSVN